MPVARPLKKVLTPWAGLPNDFDPEPFAGFIYLITEISSGRQYLGKKMFWRNLRKKVKGRKNRRKVKCESDWKYYKGSSKEVLQGLQEQGLSTFRFDIISVHKTRSQVNYEETKELFKREVLTTFLPSGAYAYYNACIGGKWYRGKV